MEQILSALVAIVVGVGVATGYFFGANALLDGLARDGRDSDGRLINRAGVRGAVRPWIFVGPALALLFIFLIWPALRTIYLSLLNASGSEFIGLSNYRWALGDQEFHLALLNNFLWLIVVPTLSTAMGMIVAVLADRVKWGQLAKIIVFMPMAISFVGASVIWKFVYHYRGAGETQIGLLNAFVTWLGFDPVPWISVPFWNNFFLMIILVWIQTGFAMVIFSAALRGVPEDTIEAARMDGANELQIFFRIMIPQITSTILVVWTTITIIVLKVFDIVLTMTNGQWQTEVLANLMYDWMFKALDFGRGSAIAVVIMLAVVPIMVWNIKRFNEEEKGR